MVFACSCRELLSPAGTMTAPSGGTTGPVSRELTPHTTIGAPNGALPEPEPELGGGGGGATIVSGCCTCGAGANAELPAWLASTTHWPTPRKLTVEAERLHALVVDDGSMENTTGLPEAPPVAVTR
jgi:hypothetical protein